MEEKLPSIKVSFNYIEKIKEMIIPPMSDGSLVYILIPLMVLQNGTFEWHF